MSFPYYCQQCGGEVKVTDDGLTSRACGHDKATIVAERTSLLYGEGGVVPQGVGERIMAAVQKIQAAFK
jgi:hypothetical protein